MGTGKLCKFVDCSAAKNKSVTSNDKSSRYTSSVCVYIYTYKYTIGECGSTHRNILNRTTYQYGSICIKSPENIQRCGGNMRNLTVSLIACGVDTSQSMRKPLHLSCSCDVGGILARPFHDNPFLQENWKFWGATHQN